ncbi:MAG: NAD(P)-dependent oxidoreductase [Candidatus Zixiibacteriota bacterium]
MEKALKTLVTGSNGFVGSHLVEDLLSRGYKVSCLVRKTSNLRWIEGLKVRFVYGELKDKESLKNAVQGQDFVFHLGGLTKAQNSNDYYKANHEGTKNLVEATLESNPGIKRFIYVSSQAAVGPGKDTTPLNEDSPCNPITDYGKSKLLGEKAVLFYRDKLPITIIRPPGIYGPRDTEIFTFFKLIKNHIKPLFGFRENYLSLVYVKDLVEGICLASESKKAIGQTYFIANEKPSSFSEAQDLIQKALNVKAIAIRIPIFLFIFSAFLSQLFSTLKGEASSFNTQKAREISERFWICDVSKAKEELGFKTKYRLEQGITETVDWYNQNNWL